VAAARPPPGRPRRQAATEGANPRLVTTGNVWHNPSRMGHRVDSATSASRAALSRFEYAYAYPYAWRFS
jgi:hypothetical protein